MDGNERTLRVAGLAVGIVAGWVIVMLTAVQVRDTPGMRLLGWLMIAAGSAAAVVVYLRLEARIGRHGDDGDDASGLP